MHVVKYVLKYCALESSMSLKLDFEGATSLFFILHLKLWYFYLYSYSTNEPKSVHMYIPWYYNYGQNYEYTYILVNLDNWGTKQCFI